MATTLATSKGRTRASVATSVAAGSSTSCFGSPARTAGAATPGSGPARRPPAGKIARAEVVAPRIDVPFACVAVASAAPKAAYGTASLKGLSVISVCVVIMSLN